MASRDRIHGRKRVGLARRDNFMLVSRIFAKSHRIKKIDLLEKTLGRAIAINDAKTARNFDPVILSNVSSR